MKKVNNSSEVMACKRLQDYNHDLHGHDWKAEHKIATAPDKTTNVAVIQGRNIAIRTHCQVMRSPRADHISG